MNEDTIIKFFFVKGRIMKSYIVIANPYATVYGTIEIPDDVENLKKYTDEHFRDIKFGEPELDYFGTDLKIEKCEY